MNLSAALSYYKCVQFLDMDEDQTDSLEGWIAVKDDPFVDTSRKSRVEFLVAWNDVESKIAVTCRQRSRIAADENADGWSGAFSFRELKAIHEQLALVHPSLGPYVPDLPIEPYGLWAYFSSSEPPNDTICDEIHQYLRIAVDVCGQSLVISTLFEENSYENYYENISELKRRVYDEAVHNAEDQLQNVLFLRKSSINMLDMCEVYKLEDEALFKLNISLAELYNYLIQPFLDMRELAFNKLKEAKHGLHQVDVGTYGQRRKAEFSYMFTEWQENYVHALDRIQEFYIEYYTKTVNIQKGKLEEILS